MHCAPTADDVAIAIVTASRFTDEDPISVAAGKVGLRARHYALHALLHVFPELERDTACRLVGCPGRPNVFWNQSWHQVFKPNRYRQRMVGWWSEDEFGAVIAAIERGAVISPPKLDLAALGIAPAPPEPPPDPRPALRELAFAFTMRREPATSFTVVTREFMGDPGPGRSALDQKLADGCD